MKKHVALLLLAVAVFCLVSCKPEPEVTTMTITIHNYDGTFLTTINDVPSTIKTWADLIKSEYNTLYQDIHTIGGPVLVKMDAFMAMSVALTDADGENPVLVCVAANSTQGISISDALVKDVYMAMPN
ncbi:MAG: hypothetical protein KBS81_05455 [Spirochaetales bacterium]|nr:hypothetical protein [Candidatus Physcosoma equi]